MKTSFDSLWYFAIDLKPMSLILIIVCYCPVSFIVDHEGWGLVIYIYIYIWLSITFSSVKILDDVITPYSMHLCCHVGLFTFGIMPFPSPSCLAFSFSFFFVLTGLSPNCPRKLWHGMANWTEYPFNTNQILDIPNILLLRPLQHMYTIFTCQNTKATLRQANMDSAPTRTQPIPGPWRRLFKI